MAEFQLETSIESCVIYQRGVKVTRSGTVKLPVGPHTISIELPEQIDSDSVRVKGKGDGMILNINVEKNFREETPRENVKVLAEELNATKKEIKRLEKDKVLLEQKKAQIGTLQDNFYANFPKLLAAGESKIERFEEFTSHQSAVLTEVAEKIRNLAKTIDETKIKAEILLRKLQKLGQAQKVTTFHLLKVNVNARKEGEFRIFADYQSPSAFWTPLYDAILGEGDASIKIMANCVNQTGEDWKDINLDVSTATMTAIRAEKPSPFIVQELVVVLAPPTVYRRDLGGVGNLPSGVSMPCTTTSVADMDDLCVKVNEEKEKEEDKAPEKPQPVVREQTAQVSDAVGVQTFKLPGKVAIPSDNDSHPVTLATIKLPSKKKLFWSNAKPDLVVAQDALTNGDIVLLAGKVKTYYKDEFIGETTIPLVAPNEEFKIGSRASFDIKVTKKLVDRSKEKKLVKSKYIQNYNYAIEIKNLGKVEGLLKVYDRIPHSNSEKIKVIPEFPDLAPNKQQMGILKWKIDLKGLETKKISYNYIVEWDKEIQIYPPLA